MIRFIQTSLEELESGKAFSQLVSEQNAAEVPREPAYQPPKGKMKKLVEVLQTHGKFSPVELSALTGISLLSITARLRDARKAQYGGHNVLCEETAKGSLYFIPKA